MATPPTENRPTLSAVVISRNEQQNLPHLLDNLADWVDEIVIVDDKSTDDTPGIAMEAGDGVRFVSHAMVEAEGYAGQRNVGIDNASGDWLIHLDCDERIPRDLAQEILDHIRSTNYDAYRYRRQNYFLHRPVNHGGWDSWNRPQLARRGCHRFVGALHESCEIDGGEARIGQLEKKIAHLNEGSFAERLQKSARYVAMNAQDLERSGKPVSGFSIVAGSLVEFIKRYILQRGFLDGVPGMVAAIHSATSVFRTRALVWDRQNAIDRDSLEKQVSWKG